MLKNSYTYLIALFLLLPINLHAEDDSWSNVFKFQTKMAEMGNVHAQYILGEMYEEGRGVKKDLVKAIDWYSKAQANGDSNAAGRISKIKNDIAQQKLDKKLKSNKQAKTKSKPAKKKKTKKKSTVKNKPTTPKASKPKQTIAKKAKPKATPVIVKKPTQAPKTKVTPTVTKAVVKEPRKMASPEDFSRGKGTHLDDIEDPFD